MIRSDILTIPPVMPGKGTLASMSAWSPMGHLRPYAACSATGCRAPFAVVPRDGCGWTFSLPPTCDDLPMSRSFVGLIDSDIIDGQDGSARSRMSITPDGTLADR